MSACYTVTNFVLRQWVTRSWSIATRLLALLGSGPTTSYCLSLYKWPLTSTYSAVDGSTNFILAGSTETCCGGNNRLSAMNIDRLHGCPCTWLDAETTHDDRLEFIKQFGGWWRPDGWLIWSDVQIKLYRGSYEVISTNESSLLDFLCYIHLGIQVLRPIYTLQDVVRCRAECESAFKYMNMIVIPHQSDWLHDVRSCVSGRG